MQPRSLSASFDAEAHQKASSKDDKEGCWVPVKLVVAAKAAVDNALAVLDTHMNRLGMLDEDFREQDLLPEIYETGDVDLPSDSTESHSAKKDAGPQATNEGLESEGNETDAVIETPESGDSDPTNLTEVDTPNSITEENLPEKIQELRDEIDKRDREKRKRSMMDVEAYNPSTSAGSGKGRASSACAKAKPKPKAKANASKAHAKAKGCAKAKAKSHAKGKPCAKHKASPKARAKAQAPAEWSPTSLGKKIRSVPWLKHL